MFWFKAGSNRSYPNIIYTDGKRADNCKKSPNTGKKCIYNFPKNISSSDPGTYYCAVATCGEILLGNVIRKEGGNSKKTSSYTVVQQSTASESSRPQESETLQCSVLSESENNSCSEDLSMFWFKAGSNRPYPNIIYTDTKRANNCEKSPNTRRKCTYNFPKNISSSDPGTYYCAVATCGEILLGNVIRKEGGQTPLYKIPILLITITIMTFSLTVNVILICYQSHDLAGQIIKESSSEEERKKFNQQRDEIPEDRIWSTVRYIFLNERCLEEQRRAN
ncbi:PREDICTED: uncharacterized protein LOC107092917 [Cyprinodon variegatus]|uniref:uncharacterized protein LOC107092917 n=1 Tax=Cyprinodon variegatus TaxID=28743 RepID=UPI000742A7D3|nr:PREDICTED: uncharacterized protein LOC107092917 [Cyprinodon variegatus]